MKSDCRKDFYELAKEWFDGAGEWCREHWKAVKTALIVIAAVALMCTGIGYGLSKAFKALKVKIWGGKGGLEPGTLSNVDARKWYLEQEAKIPDLIDDGLPLEQQARQAFDLRNQYRMQARELMSDRQLAESLYASDPNLTWEQIIQKQIDKGLSGDEIYKAIIESSQRSRTSVNQLLGLE